MIQISLTELANQKDLIDRVLSESLKRNYKYFIDDLRYQVSILDSSKEIFKLLYYRYAYIRQRDIIIPEIENISKENIIKYSKAILSQKPGYLDKVEMLLADKLNNNYTEDEWYDIVLKEYGGGFSGFIDGLSMYILLNNFDSIYTINWYAANVGGEIFFPSLLSYDLYDWLTSDKKAKTTKVFYSAQYISYNKGVINEKYIWVTKIKNEYIINDTIKFYSLDALKEKMAELTNNCTVYLYLDELDKIDEEHDIHDRDSNDVIISSDIIQKEGDTESVEDIIKREIKNITLELVTLTEDKFSPEIDIYLKYKEEILSKITIY